MFFLNICFNHFYLPSLINSGCWKLINCHLSFSMSFMLFMNHASLIKVYPFLEKYWMILFLFHSLKPIYCYYWFSVSFMLFINHDSLIKVSPFMKNSWMILFCISSFFLAFFILLVYLICR
jgi:hypothetical protein